MLAHPSRPVDPNHAVYDGKQLRRASDGVVIYRNDERWELITHVVVRPEVTAIHPEAFRGCTSLTSVLLPEGLITIGGDAFAGCTSLSSVTLPEGLTAIEQAAFYGCTSLTSIILPEGLTTIGSSAFRGCTSLSSGIIPEGLTTIGWYAFYGCTSLTSISIPESVPLVYTPSQDSSDDDFDDQDVRSGVAPYAFRHCTLLSQLSGAKSMSVEQFLRWRRRAPSQRYAVQAALLRLRTELYERQRKRARRATEEVGGGESEEGGEQGEEEEAQYEAQELQGKLAFDIITSEDVWRHILEFL